MGRKIAIIADSHDHLNNLQKAVKIIKKEKVDRIIHLGDFVAPFTLPILKSVGIPLIGVFGNNDGEKRGLLKGVSGWGEIHQPPFSCEIEGRAILLSHSFLKVERVQKQKPETEFLFYGHTHIPTDEMQGKIRFINPGELCGYLYKKATFGIIDLPSGNYCIIELSK